MEWAQLGSNIDGEAAGDHSGSNGIAGVSLSADGARLAVGAPYNDDGGAEAGHARVFELVSGAWTQLGGDIDGEAEGDHSGYSVSLSADGARLAVGAPYNDDGGAKAGHARVFELVSGAWSQIGGDIGGEAAGDWAGYSVSLSADGARLAVGAIRNSGATYYAGHVRVFELVSGAWAQLGADIDGEVHHDHAGHSVSLSADGARLAVGAPGQAGYARVFELVSGTWTQLGGDIVGEAAGDSFGYTVSLSADGARLAVGAPLNDDGGSNAGHARVFELIAGPGRSSAPTLMASLRATLAASQSR